MLTLGVLVAAIFQDQEKEILWRLRTYGRQRIRVYEYSAITLENKHRGGDAKRFHIDFNSTASVDILEDSLHIPFFHTGFFAGFPSAFCCLSRV